MSEARVFAGWSREQILERRESLKALKLIAVRRACCVDTEAAKVQIEELEVRLLAIQRMYGKIDTTGFPNVIVSSLSSLQGQEREVRTQLGIWKNAKEAQKKIDEDLLLCEKVLIEKREEFL